MVDPSDAAASDGESSLSDPLDMRGEEGWEDVEDDEIPETFQSLFDEKSFNNVSEMFYYCKSEYNFDIWQLQRQYELDFLGLVRIVNYVRKETQQGNSKPDLTSKSVFDDDLHLLPILENDAVLHNLEDVLQNAREATVNEVEELRDQLNSLKIQFDSYRNDVQKYLNDRLDSEPVGPLSGRNQTSAHSEENREDLDYFNSYSYNSIHESMLKDKVRTDAYRDFIYDNKDLFSGKVVLDVGCGTGILSMLSAKAGAKLVIAVDNSAIVEQAKQIIQSNGLSGQVICIRGKIEEVKIPVEQVDIIVSEWMGYCLLYESMLDSVLFARDKYLAPGGLMVPSHATIELAPLANSELRASHIDFWKDVYGFDMTSMADKAEEETLIRTVHETELAAQSISILKLDLHKTNSEDLKVNSRFDFNMQKQADLLEGFIIWFDIFFLRSSSSEHRQDLSVQQAKERGMVAFSTGPNCIPTHWQQGVCLIKDPQDFVAQGKSLTGRTKIRKGNEYLRSLDIEIEWQTSSDSKRLQRWVVD